MPLKELTTMKIGGIARYFVVVSSEEELMQALDFAQEKQISTVVLGGGSNMLIADGEINKLFIKVEIRGVEWDIHGSETERSQPQYHASGYGAQHGSDTEVVVGAGENWDAFVAETVNKGLWGLENLSGIPGTVGAAPIQNIGAYGVEIKDTLLWVDVFDVRTGEVVRLSNKECKFSYRDSIFKQEKGEAFIVLRVAFELQKNGGPRLEYKDMQERFKKYDVGVKNEDIHKKKITLTPQDIRKEVLDIRAGKFPDLSKVGTAGSFFKNPIITKEKFDELKTKFPRLPGFEVHKTGQNETNTESKRKVKVSLAWILDNVCELKGYSKGDVSLFERQPIVLVNFGNATSEEVLNFSEHIKRCVKEKTEIEIEFEVQRIK